MSRRTGRSFASAVRVSLLGLGGALGLLTLAASAATADGGSEQSLVGSVASVVESAAAPVGGVVGAVADSSSEPAASVAEVHELQPAVHPSADLIGSVPEVIASVSAVETATPVGGLIDATVSQVPVVNQTLPSGAATAATQPVMEAADAGLAQVLGPVEQAAPIVEVLEPVTDVVDAVVKPAAPVIAVPAPIKVPHPVDAPELEDPVVTPLPVVSQTDEIPSVSFGPESPATRADEEQVTSENVIPTPAAPRVPSGAIRGLSEGTDDKVRLPQLLEVAPSSSVGAHYELPELPTLGSGETTDNISDGALPGSAPGSSANSGAGSGVGAADAVPCLNISLANGGSSSYVAANPMLQSPSFDPGSTPD